MRLSGSVKVELRQADRDAVEVETDDNLQPLIQLVQRDGALDIAERGPIKPTQLSIVVFVRRLESIAVGGAAGLVAPGPWLGERLRLDVGGAGVVKFSALAVEHVGVDAGGSSVLNLGGRAGVLKGALGGAATLSARRLQAREADLRVGGSAQAVLWVRESLQGSVGGAGGLRYYGKPRTDVSRGGAGKVAALGAEPPP
nr:head GIN domain-containing protein [Aquabacterium terrae]